MDYEIIGIDLSRGEDKTVYVKKIQDKIYQAYGLTREQVETKESNEQLETFLKINNIN